jgi:PPOX class probable F420-dependent enzyme
MRANLRVEDLNGLLDEPILAVLATIREDGTPLLSPVWHRWRDGGFEVWMGSRGAKARHLRRDPRATVLVAEQRPPYRGLEARGPAESLHEGVREIAVAIAARYLGDERAAAYVEDNGDDDDVILRVTPDVIRAWDFADEYDPSGR